MKKVKSIAIYIVFVCIVCNLSLSVKANNINTNDKIISSAVNLLKSQDIIDDHEIFLSEHVDSYSLYNPYYDLYNKAIDRGYLYLDTNGQIIITEEITQLAAKEIIEEFMQDMDFINILISIGLCELDPCTYQIISTVEDYLNNPNSLPISSTSSVFLDSLAKIQPKGQEPTDGNPPTYINLGSLVRSNYAYIKNVFADLSKYNAAQAWTLTVCTWVSLVMEGGAWDYKTQAGYAPWYKTFNAHFGRNNSKYRVVTSEFIGNYNYGYTGRQLFNLSVLKAGSFAASGFDSLDSSDYPAIEEGYNDSGSIE
ncbi:MAG: polymorphic toxin type 44 domain-containing protein [Clostridiales bacterium]|nr:polymorphic toxin type 44 domain-containing protein [Clostridiales bacterium]